MKMVMVQQSIHLAKIQRNYSLVCFAQHINSDERSDRVIATKWDAAFVLHDGVPTKEDIKRLKENVPKQEVGKSIIQRTYFIKGK